MSNNVWTTTIMFDENYRVFDLSFPDKFNYVELYKIKGDSEEEKKQRKQQRNVKIEIVDQYHLSKKIESVNAPTILYAYGFGKTVKLPSFFRTQDGFVILTEACANVLKKFRLGQSALYPLSFFDIKLNEPVNDQTYYFLNIAELRSYLRPEYCTEELDKHSYTKNEGYQLYKLYHADYTDHAIAIKKEAVNCDVDLWQDPELNHSIFISDELKKALDDLGMGNDWNLFKCKL
ncbi:hypothetical protein ABFP28_16990 [Acinetobacter baumannii]